jgi:hypothetical protein
MDEMVLKAMQKWPNVPACYGWLGLGSRGEWYMRDAQTQALGDFTHSKGSKLMHDGLIAFIGRNYVSDTKGKWYFQNGPQRVFVELANAPWVWRVEPQGEVVSHTGQVVKVQQAVTDEQGHLYFVTDHGFGLVHTQDIQRAISHFELLLLAAQVCEYEELPQQFGFVRSPERAIASQSNA